MKSVKPIQVNKAMQPDNAAVVENGLLKVKDIATPIIRL